MRLISEALLRLMVGLQEFRKEHGQTLAEYGLIMAVIAIATVVGAVVLFREAIITAFNNAVGCLDGSC
jgi:Flp pilus assembly pilin Flp